ncbi:MAG: restriction endonuclease subunit S [Verrucomicrobia bacterium]|nr:restriction endonuclease subunit S [Verrucomicrobiota bacterium]
MTAAHKWPSVKLSEVSEINPRRPAHLLKLNPNHQVTFVPMPAINQKSGTIEGTETRHLSEVRKGFTHFQDGDVLFAKITPCMQNGKSALAINLVNGLGFGSTEFHIIRPDPEKLLAEWIWYFVRQGAYRREAMYYFQGAVGQQRVPSSYLEKTVIPLPPVPEQRRIVARIKECMERIEEIERLQADAVMEAEATLPSLLNETFISLARKFRPTEIGAVALETRYGTSRKCGLQAQGTAILRIPNVVSGSVTFADLKYCEIEDQERERILLKDGDILFVRTNGSRDLVGRCAVFESPKTDCDFAFASYLIRVRLDLRKMRPHFLAFFLNSSQGRTELNKRRRTSAGQFNINSENLKNIEVPAPPIDLQDCVVDLLRERRAQVLALQEEMTDARQDESHLRDAILRKAFAGDL